MGLTSQAYFAEAGHTKSALEKRLDREKIRADKTRLAAERRKKAAAKRQRVKESQDFKKVAKELLKGLEVEITFAQFANRAEFTFKGKLWYVAYEHWTLGEQGVDCYVTEHEGWKLHGPFDNWGHVLYEVNKHATPPALGPQSLKAGVERCLRGYVNGISSIYW